MQKIPLTIYQNADTVAIAKSLLGKILCTYQEGIGLTTGLIIETEAYNGITDKACHSYGNRLTNRTKTMFEAGGIAYIYLCYGMYELFNVVTAEAGNPCAVLIRALEPLNGIDIMLKRRKLVKVERRLTAGPSMLSQALGITRNLNGYNLDSETIWIEESGKNYTENEIVCSPRVGVGYAGEDALLPWRFRII